MCGWKWAFSWEFLAARCFKGDDPTLDCCGLLVQGKWNNQYFPPGENVAAIHPKLMAVLKFMKQLALAAGQIIDRHQEVDT